MTTALRRSERILTRLAVRAGCPIADFSKWAAGMNIACHLAVANPEAFGRFASLLVQDFAEQSPRYAAKVEKKIDLPELLTDELAR